MTSALGYAVVGTPVHEPDRDDPAGRAAEAERARRPEMRTWKAEEARQFSRRSRTSGSLRSTTSRSTRGFGAANLQTAVGLTWTSTGLCSASTVTASPSRIRSAEVAQASRRRPQTTDGRGAASVAARPTRGADRLGRGVDRQRPRVHSRGRDRSASRSDVVDVKRVRAKGGRSAGSLPRPPPYARDARPGCRRSEQGYAERLGHATAQITLDLYSHVIPGMDADADEGSLLRSAPSS